MANATKLAVLIDADNAPPTKVDLLLAEVSKYGTAHVKRAYGDWTGQGLTKWKDNLLRHSIQPIQQFAYTQGKNATDSAMIIDAMDLLYTNRLDGFCIVSSDSDFTRLASRIRESGLTVFGFGEKKTPQPFVSACDKFIYFEILNKDEVVHSPTATSKRPRGRYEESEKMVDDSDPDPPEVSRNKMLLNTLGDAVRATSDDNGWANLAKVGSFVTRQKPDFDSRNFGYDKLIHLVVATKGFETEVRSPGPHKPPVVYIRSLT
ncbi:hypothetical protein CMQ_5892 [Grosmannia clavigera kw1407]|uniref:HTH OST-type domain-containing protein n=1 Tax=Grosmannia clavigera (strain kw1407 / UAMH 11150) TaxID=655863 RepID=F0XIJ4_GROCL|nr:uncharacterized protein CMQ_5892 [Grosmannia clavigera kw1407]EFX02531.1 hypothetical protein CMQ_5892 [Grosmannia clavigera kw1407]